jgi:hypothetical protein
LYFYLLAGEHNHPLDYSIKGVDESNGLEHCDSSFCIHALVRLLPDKTREEGFGLII